MPRRPRQFSEAPSALDPEDPLVLRAQARLLADQQDALDVYGATGDPWLFVRDLVYTLDEAAARIRRFPSKAYLERLARLFQREKLLAVPKSRRMLVTWLFVALFYHRARFTPGGKFAFMARKEGKTESEGSNELVKRAKFIHEHLIPVLPPLEIEYSMGRLTLANGAEILALGEGADQARQYSFTGVLGDEIGFWTQALETWTALKPTVQGGGQIVLISSAYPGFWRDLVFDQLLAA